MKKAAKLLLCINLLVFTILVFQVLEIRFSDEGGLIFAGSGHVKSKTEQNIEKKKVALTFDDGPDPEYTEKLLDGLKERNVKATFFLLGKQVKLYPDIVKRMYEEGHIIGNHSFDHVNLATLSGTDAASQIAKTNEIIHDITGKSPEYLRPPFGNEPQGEKGMEGMITVLWDVDPLDWCCGSSGDIVNKVIKSVKEDDIILMHDASQSSVNAALKVVDELTKKGYEFVTVDELIFE